MKVLKEDLFGLFLFVIFKYLYKKKNNLNISSFCFEERVEF